MTTIFTSGLRSRRALGHSSANSSGDKEGAVTSPERTAKKYFGSEDAMGKVIEMDKSLRLKVTGIAKDVPSNSHLDFDLVMPISNYQNALDT